MKINNNNYFSRKLVSYNFLLSIFVIILHATNTTIYPLKDNMGVSGVIFYWFQEYIAVLGLIAVPSFFIISGYLFYRNFSIDKVWIKYKSRLFSLLVPYIIWNFISFLFFSIITNLPFIGDRMSMDKVVFNIGNLLDAIISGRYNVLWFVQNLIIFVILSPIIYLLMQKKNVGIPLLGVITLLNFVIPQGEYGLVYCSGYYLFGALVGIHYTNLISIKSHKIVSILSVLTLLILCFVGMKTNIVYYLPLRFLLLLILAIFGWISFDLITYPCENYWWIKVSFFMYCSHSLILESIEKLGLILFGKTLIGAIICYIFAPIFTVIIILVIARVLQKNFNKLWIVITGARG